MPCRRRTRSARAVVRRRWRATAALLTCRRVMNARRNRRRPRMAKAPNLSRATVSQTQRDKGERMKRTHWPRTSSSFAASSAVKFTFVPFSACNFNSSLNVLFPSAPRPELACVGASSVPTPPPFVGNATRAEPATPGSISATERSQSSGGSDMREGSAMVNRVICELLVERETGWVESDLSGWWVSLSWVGRALVYVRRS